VAVLAVTSVTVGAALLSAGVAAADTAPPTGTPATPSADSLPTVQIDGVVWSQIVIGNRVYATGEFTTARPAGAAPGTSTTPRANLLAYDITTGQLDTNFVASLNAQGQALAASADGQTLFVVGDFTQVNGVGRNRVAALDAATGAVRNILTSGTNSRVRTIAVRGDSVYVGGIFTTAGGQPRNRLAAYSASTGALLPWAPSADAEVMAMTAPPGGDKVVVGGRFTTLNGEPNYGLGALGHTTGSTVPFAANAIVRNAGADASIYNLSSTATQVFGTGYTYGPGGNLENTFSAAAADGALTWVSGCRGDTYTAAPVGDVVYTVGHPHDCSQIGTFPQTQPWTYQRAIAFRMAPSGRPNLGGSFNGRPAPEMLHWLPTLATGDYTGASQGAWSVAGNAQYVVLGGEFPSVNGVAQQGLTRFAVRSAAPNVQGPQGRAQLLPTFTAAAPGTVRATFQAAWDRDNARLTYELLRGPQLSTTTVVARTQLDSAWWNRPSVALVDATAPPGSSQSYRVRAIDPLGNVAISDTLVTTVPTGTPSQSGGYSSAVQADGPGSYWRLGEPSGSLGVNWSGSADLTLAGVQRGAAGALAGDADTATTFTGSATVPGTTTTAVPGPQTFTVEAWFRTTSTTGGKIIGFGDRNNANSAASDRHIYMTNSGQLVFGVNAGGVRTLTSPGGLNNGQWHHVVGTLGAGGLRLYVDGQLVGERADTTSAQVYSGFWRVGGDVVGTAWPTRPTSSAFNGTIDEVAVYGSVLPAQRVLAHSELGRGVTPNAPPTAAFTSTATGLTASLDAAQSTDPDGTVAGYAWAFGDGATGTGAQTQHAYAAPGTYTVTLTVTDDDGATAATTRSVVVTALNQPPTAAFTSSAAGNVASFDAAGSTDADGTVTGYSWAFGDGTTGTGRTTQRAYTAAGTYSVTLTVTDDDGATATSTRSVTVAAPPVGPLATDAFGRTVASGFGTADAGGSWTVAGSSATTSVSGGTGIVSLPASKAATLRLPSVSSAATDVRHTVSLDAMPTGGGTYLSTTARSTADGDYRAKVRVLATGEVQVSLVRVVGVTETTIAAAVTVNGITYAPGMSLTVRVQAFGTSPTTVQAKVWQTGAAEPGSWQRSVTDATAGFQGPGAVGFYPYVSGSSTAPVVTRYDNLAVTGI
jgi:PKD repeat protein